MLELAFIPPVLGHNVLNTNVRPTKGCKYVDICVVFFKKKKQKTVFWGWSPRPDDVGQKSLNLTCYDVTHKKQMQTFQFFNRKLHDVTHLQRV